MRRLDFIVIWIPFQTTCKINEYGEHLTKEAFYTAYKPCKIDIPESISNDSDIFSENDQCFPSVEAFLEKYFVELL